MRSPSCRAEQARVRLAEITRQKCDSSGFASGNGTKFPPGHYQSTGNATREAMMDLVVTLLIVGLIAAVLGFGGIAGASFAAAKIIFFIILVLLLISIVFGTMGARRPFW
jgi:uncharacterized membrane protein YtjA (UPF0391 family)